MSFPLAMLQIVACAATAATTTYGIVESRERRQFLSAKAEELYTLVETTDREMTEFFAEAYSAIAAATFASRAESALARARQASAKIRMLVGFYFPTLRPPLRVCDTAAAIALASARGCDRTDENALLRLDQTVVEMKDAYEALRHAVIAAHRDGRGRLFGLRRPQPQAPGRRALRMAV